MLATILLVDDHPVFRQGLRHLLASEDGLTVVGEADDGRMAIEQVQRKHPDLVVMDINMPNLDGIKATRQILSDAPETKVVALSVHSGKKYVRDMIQAGALGYILKESIPEEMMAGIQMVLAGDIYLSKSISSILISDYKTLIPEVETEPDNPTLPILYTKLHRPPISAEIIPRARLIERLETGVQYPLSLIAAPAGYGKSILVSQWQEVSEQPNAWVSLDEGDNSLWMFVSYVVEAILSLFPGLESSTRALLESTHLPSSKVTAHHLLNDLESLPERFILAVDDYHYIRSTAVHDLLTEMLLHPSSRMHLVLITRRDPPLPLTSLRSRGMLSEISAKDLRFSVLETQSYLERFLRIAIDDDTARVLEEKMEGWVTGLHLAALSIKNEADQKRMVTGLLKSSHYVRDYLVEEVLSQVPAEFESYVLATSILNRFCASLCDAIVREGEDNHRHVEADVNGRTFINWLNEKYLFAISLDTDNRWFRYHHVFQDLLQGQLKQKLGAEAITAHHSRASRWFGENGLIEEAIQHALKAGDIEFAVTQVEQCRCALMNEEWWNHMRHLLQMFPAHVVAKHPELLILRAWIAYDANRMEEIKEILDLTEPLHDGATVENNKARSLHGELYALLGYKANVEADVNKAMAYLQKAIKRLSPEHTLVRGQVAASYCIARQMSGDQVVVQEIEQTLTAENGTQKGAFHSRKLAGYCFVNWMKGDLAGLLQDAEQLLRYAQKGSLPETNACARYFFGIACYYRNELSMAEKYLTDVAKNIYLANGIVGVQSCFALALMYQIQGHTGKAREILEMAAGFAKDRQSPISIQLTQAFQVEIDLLQGRMDQAQRWADQFNPNLFRALTWFYFPPLTLVKARLAQGTPDSLQQAADLLDRLDAFVVSIHNTRFRIEILALQALLNNSLGQGTAALKKLDQSLALAKPGGFIRNYVDMGPAMDSLLKRRQNKTPVTDYVKRILTAFKEEDQDAVSEAAEPTPSFHQPPGATRSHQPLIEPLTNRELDVLVLLADRFQNKEIADKLFISTETVKGHLRNVYQKLSVKNRREAVLEAKHLDII